MVQYSPQFAPFAARMQAENLPLIFIDTFAQYYEKLVTGNNGLIHETDIVPVSQVPNMETLPGQLVDAGQAALAQTVLIKLNGGLGTSMGLEKAKSLLRVKNDSSFLDIISYQAVCAGVPLVLMNSFATDEDSLTVLGQHSELLTELPLSFLQHKEPKISRSDFSPAVWPDKPAVEWCPPGHGDIYTALITRGILDSMLNAGYRYAFVSNADNLGAVLNSILLGYFAENEFPLMIEIADRTEMDKKGGHLARWREDGRYVLRELAQCPNDDLDAFQDIHRHSYFNTNNLWINLDALRRIMAQRNNRLGLPMIRNLKTIDPRDSMSTPVYQLETAMGSAISVFDGSHAVRVPRTRFAPVKKTDDLLAVRSDAYILSNEYEVIPNPERSSEPPIVALDSRYYKFVTDLDARFPNGAPSLLHCDRLHVVGDFLFEEGVICRGSVELHNETKDQIVVPAGTILEG